MRIGYARVSKGDDQDNAAQLAALKKARCTKFFKDEASGALENLPGRAAAIAALKKGDVLIVWKLDRFSRSLLHLSQFLVAIDAAGASFQSLTERAIDTTSAGGKLLLQILGSFAEFELNQISARTRLGLAQAKRNGVRLGPPMKLDGAQIDAALELRRSKSIAATAHALGVSPATLKRALKRRREAPIVEATKARDHGKKTAAKTHTKRSPNHSPRRRRPAAIGRKKRRARG